MLEFFGFEDLSPLTRDESLLVRLVGLLVSGVSMLECLDWRTNPRHLPGSHHIIIRTSNANDHWNETLICEPEWRVVGCLLAPETCIGPGRGFVRRHWLAGRCEVEVRVV